ncbi:MAG: hypothetical protein LBF84_01320 [Holosporales bacterium]|nr:hypothetical protein [Holosporales bacterium]
MLNKNKFQLLVLSSLSISFFLPAVTFGSRNPQRVPRHEGRPRVDALKNRGQTQRKERNGPGPRSVAQPPQLGQRQIPPTDDEIALTDDEIARLRQQNEGPSNLQVFGNALLDGVRGIGRAGKAIGKAAAPVIAEGVKRTWEGVKYGADAAWNAAVGIHPDGEKLEKLRELFAAFASGDVSKITRVLTQTVSDVPPDQRYELLVQIDGAQSQLGAIHLATILELTIERLRAAGITAQKAFCSPEKADEAFKFVTASPVFDGYRFNVFFDNFLKLVRACITKELPSGLLVESFFHDPQNKIFLNTYLKEFNRGQPATNTIGSPFATRPQASAQTSGSPLFESLLQDEKQFHGPQRPQASSPFVAPPRGAFGQTTATPPPFPFQQTPASDQRKPFGDQVTAPRSAFRPGQTTATPPSFPFQQTPASDQRKQFGAFGLGQTTARSPGSRFQASYEEQPFVKAWGADNQPAARSPGLKIQTPLEDEEESSYALGD